MTRHRLIWAFGLGYFFFYAPYSAMVKSLTTGADLPAVMLGTVLSMPLVIGALGWWKHASRVRLTAPIVASGAGTAAIIAMTTLVYTFNGVSIVFALLLMRGGVLILSPFVDLFCDRRVRWFSWAALMISIVAIVLAVSPATLPAAAVSALLLYLGGYAVRLSCMTKRAKVDDVEITRGYLVQELMVALAILAAAALVMWRGAAPLSLPAVGAGVLYSVLYLFGTLIYLDRRENTFCIPLNRSFSLLAGVIASFALGYAPSRVELMSAAMIGAALLLLSPAHHWLELLLSQARMAIRELPTPALPDPVVADGELQSTAFARDDVRLVVSGE